MEMTTVKTVAIFAVIVGCFAAIYPRMFHPLLFGNSQSGNDDMSKQLPPHLRHPRSPSDDAPRPNMKPSSHGPHPGMRAMGEMRKQAAEAKGSGRGGGIMSMVLPLYAVGIVVYMVYTLIKVFSKKDPKSNDKQQKSQNAEKTNATDLFLAGKKGQKELQQLLLKAEKDDINEDELVTLKRRLMETELQMSRILKAMEMKANADHDDNSAADGPPAADNGDVHVENLSHNQNEVNDEDEVEIEEVMPPVRANGDAIRANHTVASAAAAAGNDGSISGSGSSSRSQSSQSESSNSGSENGNDGGVEEELEEEDLDESGGEPAGVESEEEDNDEEEEDIMRDTTDNRSYFGSGDLRKRNKPGNVLPKVRLS